jgi:hypothetical protein
LKKALKLYKLSFELHRDEQASRLSTMFYMATIKNSGQIYRLRGEQELAGTCFRQLFSTLMHLSYSDQAEARKLHGLSISIWISQEGRVLKPQLRRKREGLGENFGKVLTRKTIGPIEQLRTYGFY